MRVLQVHYTDDISRSGGGLIALYRLHLGLRKAGIDSKILCRIKTPGSPESVEMPCSRKMRRVESLLQRVTRRCGLNDIHCISSFRIARDAAYRDADILDFHGIHGNFFSYLALPALTRNKPAVFTLHDMWPFTGHCTHSYDCERWRIGCGKCPYPNIPASIQRDSTHLEWKLKEWAYGRSQLTFVTLSNWITEQAKQSMIGRFPIYQIPNGVDTEIYQPIDTAQCRSVLGIPKGKRVLALVAAKLNDVQKGAHLAVEALRSLPKPLKAATLLLTLGSRNWGIAEAVGMETLNLGYVSSDHMKAIAYSAADLLVFPTRADNQPLVLQESMACGTPMVSFRVGGVPELVRPGITGYLAEPDNAKALCDGIVQVLEDESLRSAMSQQCRTIALKEYSLDLHVRRYIELYHQVLQN